MAPIPFVFQGEAQAPIAGTVFERNAKIGPSQVDSPRPKDGMPPTAPLAKVLASILSGVVSFKFLFVVLSYLPRNVIGCFAPKEQYEMLHGRWFVTV